MTTLADISSQIDEAFDECECTWADNTPHEGSTRAFVNYHGCTEAVWCAAHYQRFIAEHLPVIRRLTSKPGGGKCEACYQSFRDVDSYVKVYPL